MAFYNKRQNKWAYLLTCLICIWLKEINLLSLLCLLWIGYCSRRSVGDKDYSVIRLATKDLIGLMVLEYYLKESSYSI